MTQTQSDKDRFVKAGFIVRRGNQYIRTKEGKAARVPMEQVREWNKLLAAGLLK